jgi:dTMP kinase
LGSAKKFRLTPHNALGRFIAVEGLDGTGKTGLVRRIVSDLKSQGFEVVRVRVPTDRIRRSWMFQQVHNLNLQSDVDPLAYEVAYMADRLQLSGRVIKPSLDQGKIVVADRYLISSIGSLLVRVPELLDVIEASYNSAGWFYDLASNLVQPDISFFLHSDADVAVKRIAKKKGERAFDLDTNFYQQIFDLGKSFAVANEMVLLDTTNVPAMKISATAKEHISKILRWAHPGS